MRRKQMKKRVKGRRWRKEEEKSGESEEERGEEYWHHRGAARELALTVKFLEERLEVNNTASLRLCHKSTLLIDFKNTNL